MTTSVPLIIDTVQQSSVYLCMYLLIATKLTPICVCGQSLVSIWFHSVHCVQCIWPTWSHHGHCSSVWVQILSGSELWIQKEQKEPLKFETKLCKIWPRIFFNKEHRIKRWKTPVILFQHYLKVHRDGGPGPLLLITGVQKLNFSTQLAFLHPTHSFNSELKYFHALHNVNVNFEISYVCIYTEWIMCILTFMKMQ